MIPCIEVCSAVLDLIVSPADHFFKNSLDPDQALGLILIQIV